MPMNKVSPTSASPKERMMKFRGINSQMAWDKNWPSYTKSQRRVLEEQVPKSAVIAWDVSLWEGEKFCLLGGGEIIISRRGKIIKNTIGLRELEIS